MLLKNRLTPAQSRCILGTVVAALAAVPQFRERSSFAAQYNWTQNGSGLWNTSSNWTINGGSTHAVPGNGDDAFLGSTSSTASVTMNAVYNSGFALGNVTVNDVTSGLTILQNSSSFSMYAANLYLGTTTFDNYYNQSAGNCTFTNTLNLGCSTNQGALGEYFLSGGNLTTSSELIGLSNQTSGGGNTFNQSGGTHNFLVIYVGYGGNAIGNYLFSAGVLNVGTVFVGESTSTANVFTQSGPSTMTLTTSGGGLAVGATALGTGTFNLNGGNVSFSNNTVCDVGYGGTGIVNHTSGNMTFTGTAGMSVGYSGAGNYTLSGNGSISGAAFQIVGNTGVGTFTQSNGTNSLASGGSLTIAQAANGTYNLNGGVIQLISGVETIGTGAGVVGTFVQTAGTNLANFNSTFYVGNGANSTGIYSLQGGDLSLPIGSEYIGSNGGNGTLTQSGNSTNTLGGNFANLNIGFGLGSNGTYNLQNGNLSIAGGETIGGGGGGIGNFNQSGGNHTISGGFNIGNAGTGTYSLSNGTLNANNGENLANDSAVGNFFQSGGTHNVTGALDIGVDQLDLATGTYVLSNGTLNVTGTETVGDDGIGSFQQGGGLNNVVGTFFLGSAAGGISGETDIYALSAGNFTVTGVEYIGTGTAGQFSQTGGTNNANGGLNIGDALGSTFYALNGGVLATPSLNVNGIPSNFQWTSGTLNLTAGVAFDPAAVGNSTSVAFGNSLNLNGGMTLIVTGNETIGGTGAFTLTLNAGSSDTATGAFTVAPTGTLNQNGGTISSSLTNLGTFNYSGGTFTGQLTTSGHATFNLSGTISNGMINSGIVSPIGLGVTLTLGGAGLNNSGSLTLAGGSLNTTAATNSGLISGYGFIQATPFVNSGTITQTTGNLFINSLTVGFNNTGTVNLATGLQLQISGLAATNDGYINLNGGNINMGPTLTNAPDGTINGPGKISGVFTNNGTIALGAGNLNIVNGFTNTGLITLSSPAALFSGGAISNSGSLQGTGTIAAQVIDTGTIEAFGGALTFTGPVSDTGGTLRSSPGTKILMQGTSSFPTNTGLIDLAGGTFDNGNHSLNNTGAIVGYGVLSTGGLTNNGNFTLTGGTATVNGNVTNASPQFINIKFQPALFTGTVTNNAGATIKTTNTTATFAGPFINNGSFVSDPSTNIFQADVNSTGNMTGSTGDVYIFMSGNVTNSGNFNNGGTLQSADNVTNSGTFTQSGPQTWSNGTTFTNNAPGVATFGSDTGSAAASPLNVNITGGTVNLSATQHLNSLTITGGKAAITTGTTKTNAFTLGGSTNAWTGQLDLAANKLLVEAAINKPTVLATIQNQAVYGRTHSTGITSAALPAHTAIAVIDNGALAAPFSTFGGVAADSNSILIAPELLGDVNIDGRVNATDLNILLSNFGSTTQSWSSGNFDGQTTINLTDLSYVLNNFGLTYANSSDAIGGALNSAPEPTTLSLLLPAALLSAAVPSA